MKFDLKYTNCRSKRQNVVSNKTAILPRPQYVKTRYHTQVTDKKLARFNFIIPEIRIHKMCENTVHWPADHLINID